MSSQKDLDRIAELSRRLKEVTAEGEQIRAKIQRIAERRAHWPERRILSEALDRSDGKASDFLTPTEQTDADRN